MGSPKDSDNLLALQASIASTTALINSFHHALRAPPPAPLVIKSPPQPLALLSDSCKILKAQTTKLSLLILNKPFTPTAITYILNVCSSGCIPAMMSALELCPSEMYTKLLHNHIKSSLSRIITQFSNLMASIPQDEHGIDPQSRGTLASTGLLWGECDHMVTLASGGLVPLTLEKAEEYHGLFKDAIAELEEWDPAEDDPDSDADTLSSIKQRPVATNDPSALVEDLEGLHVSPMGKLRERSLTTLRTVRLLYSALQKRRISTFPNITCNTPPQSLPALAATRELDATIAFMKDLTETADEVAGALYEGDESQILRRLESLQEKAASCTSRARRNWNGEEDEFSEWLHKWVIRLKEVGTD